MGYLVFRSCGAVCSLGMPFKDLVIPRSGQVGCKFGFFRSCSHTIVAIIGSIFIRRGCACGPGAGKCCPGIINNDIRGASLCEGEVLSCNGACSDGDIIIQGIVITLFFNGYGNNPGGQACKGITAIPIGPM